LKEPEVGEDYSFIKPHLRPNRLEHLPDDPFDTSGHLVLLKPADGPAQDADGCLRRRRRGVAAFGLDIQFDTQESLLGNAYEGNRAGHTRYDSIRDGAAFVKNIIKMDAPAL
jgi:hypothetical protein